VSLPRKIDPLLARQVDKIVADVERDLPAKAFLDTGEVAAGLDVSIRTVQRMVQNRYLPSFRSRGHLLIPRSAVLEFVRANSAPAYPRRARDYDE